MKVFGVLAVATCLLVVAGITTGAFSTRSADQKIGPEASAKAKCDGTCCQAAADDATTRTCCQKTSTAAATCCQTAGQKCGNCGDTQTVSTTADCDGRCGEDAATSCCQDGAASRAAVMTAAPATESAPANVSGAIATPEIPPVQQEEQQQENENGTATSGDWPMWGGTIDRNMVADTTGISLDFNLEEGTRVNWVANLGSQTYGNAIVGAGKVFVGCNNAAGYRPKHEGDRGVLLCFDEQTGEFVWQLTREKLTIGRVSDWPLQGICSTPAVEEDQEHGPRLWVVTNRAELMCVDIDGFADGNDGPVSDEVDVEMQDADIIWSLDMINELGVFPHNLATSSPVIHGDLVYLLTSNGVDEAHLELPSPRAPCFLAVNKNTGEVVWEANQPFDAVLHGQWASPSIGIVNGKAQVYFPGGDGWLYALDAQTGEEIWKFDMNPKDSVWELGGRGTRNAVIATAVFKDNSLVIAVGQDPEHGEGVGHLWRIDATKTGDISPELGEIGAPGRPNPNSGMIWHYGGIDEGGAITGKPGRQVFRRTMSTVAIHDGLVFAADLSGFVHCIDFETGARYWEHDLFTGIWGSTLVADDKVFIGTEEGTLVVFAADKSEASVLKKFDTMNNSSIYSTPTIANGKMFLTDRTRLYSIEIQPADNDGK